jgi:AraC family transcriptional regulator
MSDDTALQGLSSRGMSADFSGEDGRAALRAPALTREATSDPTAAERIARLLRRAMLFLESDRQVAWRCLSDASALLGPSAEESHEGDPIAISPFRPGGLARWQAKRAVAYIEANLESKLDVRALAELVSFSKSHFSRAFKRSLGFPPMAYVMLRRIERAKVLMATTSQQLTEIALICGFADQSHLNRSFRRVIGVSPGRWRRTDGEGIGSVGRGPCEAALSTRKATSAHSGA